MPYKTECLEGIATNETDLHTLGEYSMNVKPLVISSNDMYNHNSYRDYEGNVNIRLKWADRDMFCQLSP